MCIVGGRYRESKYVTSALDLVIVYNRGPIRGGGRHRTRRRVAPGCLSSAAIARFYKTFVITSPSFGAQRSLLGLVLLQLSRVIQDCCLIRHSFKCANPGDLTPWISRMSMTRDAVAQDASFAVSSVSERPAVRPAVAPATAMQSPKVKPAWNTKDLGLRLGVDVVSAMSAGALTCPLITIIDR